MHIASIAKDRFVFDVPAEIRHLVVDLAEQLDGELDTDDPITQRLFPTAYPDDPEKDAGFQILARSELTEARHDSIETVRSSADAQEIDGATLDAWMRVVNDLRLVLGTILDVSEDETWRPPDRLTDTHSCYRCLLYTSPSPRDS